MPFCKCCILVNTTFEMQVKRDLEMCCMTGETSCFIDDIGEYSMAHAFKRKPLLRSLP